MIHFATPLTIAFICLLMIPIIRGKVMMPHFGCFRSSLSYDYLIICGRIFLKSIAIIMSKDISLSFITLFKIIVVESDVKICFII